MKKSPTQINNMNASDTAKTSPQDARTVRRLRRSRLRESQVPGFKVDDKKIRKVKSLMEHNNKTPVVLQPSSKPHSVETISVSQSPSSEDDLSTTPRFLHNSRNSNLSDSEKKKLQKIAFPPSNDPVWKSVNALKCLAKSF